jgi:hypothetical protein
MQNFSLCSALPTEIRLMIWSELFLMRAGGNLLLTCRRLFEEASPVFYSDTAFRFRSPEHLRSFATNPGLSLNRNAQIGSLELGIDCLFMTDHHMRPGRHQFQGISGQPVREWIVNADLRPWGKIFDGWGSFGFKALRYVHCYFRHFKRYLYRERVDFVDPTELWRLIYKLSMTSRLLEDILPLLPVRDCRQLRARATTQAAPVKPSRSKVGNTLALAMWR